MTRHEFDAIVREEKAKAYSEFSEILRICSVAGAGLQKAQAFIARGLDARGVMQELVAEGGHDLRSQLANSEGVPADRRNPLLVDAENRRKAAEAMAAEAVSKYKQ